MLKLFKSISPKPLNFGVIITSVQIAQFLYLFSLYFTRNLLAKTTLGKQIRATSADPELAKTIGIDTEKQSKLLLQFHLFWLLLPQL